MGRKQKYFTEEERRQANRDKFMRFYEKNKKQIQKKNLNRYYEKKNYS